MSLSHDDSKEDLRFATCNIGEANVEYYSCFLPGDGQTSFKEDIRNLAKPGYWNCAAGDVVPLMASDATFRQLIILRNLQAPLYINQDMQLESEPVVLILSNDHYDSTELESGMF